LYQNLFYIWHSPHVGTQNLDLILWLCTHGMQINSDLQ